MKAITTLLSVFLTMSLGAIAGTMAKLITGSFSLASWLVVFFFILLRIKIFLNDLDYCYEADRTSLRFKQEFLGGMIAWFLWIVAAVALSSHFITACLLLVVALLISTALLRISGMEEQNRNLWICFNIGYIGLILLSTLGSLVSESFSSLFMLAAIALVAYDYWRHTPFQVFEKQDC